MSVIVGISQVSGGPGPALDIRRMLDQLAHCAPDGRGVWCAHGIALGHGMLHSTRESLQEKLPLHWPDAGLAITADARIDNRRELMHACGLSSPERDVADSELILAAYQRWGAASVDKLAGDFAFAIWDDRKRELFCARDPFGIRPFFYHSSAGRFAFASQIKALFSLPEVARGLDEARIADHILGFFEDRSSTFFEGVSRLPPGHTLSVGPKGLSIQRYWRPDPNTEIRRSSDAEYSEEFRAIFAEAVHCRLRSAFPLGSMLSGGLDSSSIACMARNQMRAGQHSGPLHTFSGLFSKNQECDERSYLDPVLKSGAFLPHFIDCDQVNPFAELDQVQADLDEVVHGMGVTVPRLIYTMARKEGVRVVLDGMGGDEVVAHGVRYLSELLWSRNYSGFGRQLSAYARNVGQDPLQLAGSYLRPYFLELKAQRRWLTLGNAMLRIPREMDDPVPRFARQYALQPLAAKLARRIGFGTRHETPDSILSDDFADSISLPERLQRIRIAKPDPGCTIRESQCHQYDCGVLWLTAEELGRAAAAAQVEPRYPLLDKRVVEFCLSLPSNQRLSEGWGRAVFRRAMDQIVPDEIRWRAGKARFIGIFEQRLRSQGRELLDATIMGTHPGVTHYFNLPVLRERYRRFLAGDGAPAAELWRSANLIWWLQNSKLAADSSGEASRPCEVRA